MGIGRTQARAALSVILGATPRAQQRAMVAECVTLMHEWLAKRDAQDAASAADFATAEPAQFATFVAALPDTPVDQTP